MVSNSQVTGHIQLTVQSLLPSVTGPFYFVSQKLLVPLPILCHDVYEKPKLKNYQWQPICLTTIYRF